MLYAGYTIGLRQRPNVSGLSMLAAMAVAAFVTSVPLMIWEIASGGFVWPTPRGLLALAYVALGPAFAAQMAFMRGVELIGPGRAGVFVNLVPVFGAIMAVALLGEPFAAYHVVALALVIGGIAVAQKGAHRATRIRSNPEEPMGQWIELEPEGAGPIAAWRADPAGKPRGGVVVIQEIFGVNAHIREVTDRFASEGYLTVAPAIFDHVEKGFDVGYDAESQARGMAVAYGKLDFEQTLRDVAAAIEVAKEGGKVGIVGYCFGGSIAWAAAGRLPGLSAAVGYYGRRIIDMKDIKPARPDHAAFRREGVGAFQTD